MRIRDQDHSEDGSPVASAVLREAQDFQYGPNRRTHMLVVATEARDRRTEQ